MKRIGDIYQVLGTKRVNSLKVFNNTSMEAIRGSSVHWITPNAKQATPTQEDAFINSNKKSPIIVVIHTKLTSTLGDPKALQNKAPADMREYASKDPKVSVAGGMAIETIPDTTVIGHSYNGLNRYYRYKQTRRTISDAYTNYISTVLSIVNQDVRDVVVLSVPMPIIHKDEDWFKSTLRMNKNKKVMEINTPLLSLIHDIHAWVNGLPSMFELLEGRPLDKTFFMFTHKKSSILIHSSTLIGALSKESEEFLRQHLRITVPKSKLSKTDRVKLLYRISDSLYASQTDSMDLEVEEVEDTQVLSPEDATSLLEDTPIADVTSSFNPVDKTIGDIAKKKGLTPAKVKALKGKMEKSSALISPIDPTKTLSESSQVDPKSLTLDAVMIEDDRGVPDSSMLRNTMQQFDQKYIEEVMDKHTMAMVQSLEGAGVAIQDYKTEEYGDISGEKTIHRVKIAPIDGTSSVVEFTIPKIENDGTFMSNGTRLRMKKQKVDMPIRKTSPSRVTLSSYAGKLFVYGSDLASTNPYKKLGTHLLKVGLSGGDVLVVSATAPVNVKGIGRTYARMSEYISSVHTPHYTFSFNHKNRKELLGQKTFKETKGKDLVGKINKGNTPITMDSDGYLYNGKDNTRFNSLWGLLGKENDLEIPRDTIYIGVLGKRIPLGYAMAYMIGLNKLLKVLKAKVTFHKPLPKKEVPIGSMRIDFKDLVMVIHNEDYETLSMLQPFVKDKSAIKEYTFSEFSQQDVYYPLLSTYGIQTRLFTELDLILTIWLDPVTKGYLREMKEPDEMISLLYRAVELIKSSYAPHPTDGDYMRIRGYERVPGMVYQELYKGVRAHKAGITQGKNIKVSKFNVWNAITSDTSVKGYEDINPIADMKQREAVTLLGAGGRSKEGIVGEHRMYHENDMGVISGDTPDSNTVGINTYLTADPGITDVMGTTGRKVDTGNHTSLFSTSVMLAPSAHLDDSKRINFISIQSSHNVSMVGGEAPELRTGGEYTVADRVSDHYAYMAEADCTVVSVDEQGIVVSYGKDKQVGVFLGTREGFSEGKIYPHEIITHRKKGDKIPKGQYVAYNSNFFQLDYLFPDKLIYKQGKVITMALAEDPLTFEDSCALSSSVVADMSTYAIKRYSYILDFDMDVTKVVTPGSAVTAGDVLLIMRDSMVTDTTIFDEADLDTLRDITGDAPTSKETGSISSVVIRYNGDIKDMTKGLATATRASDKRLKKIATSSKATYYNGRVTSEYRVKGQPLLEDKLEIVISVKFLRDVGPGDKFAWGHQLKATVSSILSGEVRSASGKRIQGVFSFLSPLNRMVESFMIQGTTIAILRHLPGWLLRQLK